MAGQVWDAAALLLQGVLVDGVDCDVALAFELLDMLEDLAEEVEEEELREGQQWRRFDPEEWTATRWEEVFRFQKEDMHRLVTALQLPDTMRSTDGRKKWSGFDGLCVVLRRLAYPCRLKDLEDIFGRPREDISVIFNDTLLHLFNVWQNLLNTLMHPWLTADRLARYAEAVHRKAPLCNVWGFIDGTVRPICRPTVGQRLVYNGHKRIHALKFQSVSTPDGIIAHLYGPVEGRRHDAFLLADSGLLPQLEAHMNRPNAAPDTPAVYSLYGDPAYPLRAHLLCPFRGAALTDAQQQFNAQMSAVRVTVEWEFGKMLQLFAFTDFRKNLKVLLQPVGAIYVVSALLTNCHKCLYGSQSSSFFSTEEHPMRTPPLEEYLHL